MSADDPIPKFEPQYPASLHPDVIAECREAWMKGRPWTDIRALRGGVDVPDGAVCANSQTTFHLACPKPVEGVQYTSAFGDPVFFCEEHALKQIEWDKNLYDSRPAPPPVMTPEWQREVDAIMKKLDRKKRKTEEPEEVDL